MWIVAFWKPQHDGLFQAPKKHPLAYVPTWPILKHTLTIENGDMIGRRAFESPLFDKVICRRSKTQHYPPRLWKCTSKAKTRSFCYLSPDALKKDTHALHHPSLARSLSLSLATHLHHICDCITSPTRKKIRVGGRRGGAIYIYACAFLDVAHLITVPLYRYQLWKQFVVNFHFWYDEERLQCSELDGIMQSWSRD
jgi:hypothetical protein